MRQRRLAGSLNGGGIGPGRGAPLRLGIVGCGRIAERGYLPAIEQLPAVELTALADADIERAKRLAMATRATALVDAEELIAFGGIEAVAVATPSGLHEEIACLAAGAGLPSLVEKPPAADFAGAAALAALEPAPSIGFNRRFLQGAELLPLIPAEGWLELDLAMSFRRAGWGAHLSDDEALLDAGTHLIDLACFLTASSPIAVRSAAVEPERATLELELGRGRARIRCATDRPYAERIEVRDRSGRKIARSRTGGLRAAIGRLKGAEDPLVGSLRRQLAAFAAQVRGAEATRLADARAGALAMAVVEAARHSARLGGAEVTVAQLADVGAGAFCGAR